MAKKIKSIKIANSFSNINDAVIFMVAYDIRNFKRNFYHFWEKTKIQDLLKNNHIIGITNDNSIITKNAACRYTVTYNSDRTVNSVDFDLGKKQKLTSELHDEINDMLPAIVLKSSAGSLLDKNYIDISWCFNLESFLVKIDSNIFQVDPIAFYMRNSIIVNYELINYKTGKPLNRDDICGRSNNYSLKNVNGVRYFDEVVFSDENRKISDIIFSNIMTFFEQTTKQKYKLIDYTYIHNVLVISNKIDNINDFFCKVIGAQLSNFVVNDISASPSFKYYINECIGVITNVSDDNVNRIMSDIQILEAYKMILHLEMIVDYEVNNKLADIVNNQIYTGVLFYPGNVPIITLNLINEVKKTPTFIRFKEGVEFKINALNILQTRQKNKNGKLLNILLYILALLSSFQTLSVLESEMALPFEVGFAIICIVFVALGILWYVRENNK